VAALGSSGLYRWYALRATPSVRYIEEEMCLKVRLKSVTSSKLRTLDLLPHRCSTPLPPAASIWFENWGSWIRVKKFRFFTGNFTPKKSIFQGKFPTNFDFFSGNFTKKFDFSRQISEEFRFYRQFNKKFRFSRKISIFYRQFHKKVDFSGQISEKFRFFSDNFTQNFDFSREI